MKKLIIFFILFISLTSCQTIQYFDRAGNSCTRKSFDNFTYSQHCTRGENTENLNLNLNKPQHPAKKADPITPGN